MKKSTKLLSVLLAFVMVISVFAATMASAAAPYKPTYSDEVTEEDVELLLKDVDTLLLAKVFTGSFFESIYKAIPNDLTMLFSNSTDIEVFSDGLWSRKNTPKGPPQKVWSDEYQKNMNQYTYVVENYISRPTTALNQERFKDLVNYGDQNFRNFLTPSDKYSLKIYEDKDGNPYPSDGLGAQNKGNLIRDQKEEVDENGNVTKQAVEGSFTRFFKDHPIEVNSIEDVRKELDNVVATFLFGGLGLVSALGSKYVPESSDYGFTIPASGGDPQALYDIFEALDFISEGLGVKQTHSATEVVKVNTPGKIENGVSLWPDKDANGEPIDSQGIATEYIQNIVDALFKDGFATNVVGVIQSLVAPKSGALIYKGIAQILDALERAIHSPFGKNLGVQTDDAGNTVYTGISATLHDLYTLYQTIPTVDSDKDTKRFDIEGLVNFAIDKLNLPLSIVFMNLKEGNGKPANGLLNVTKDTDLSAVASASEVEVKVIFRHMILDRVAEAVSSADVVKIIYDYLYDNLICNTANNVVLTAAFTPVGSQSLIERLLKTDIPNNIQGEILSALKTNREPLAAHLISMVGEIKEIHHHTRLQFVAAKAPTCTENGTVAYYHCPDCGLNFAIDDPYGTFDDALTSVAIPNSATGHQHVTKIAAKKATCTTAGNVEYYRCDACGRAFKSEADAAANNTFDPTVKATGHQYGPWKEVNGKQVRTCKVCGATETKDAAASNPSNPSQPDKNLPQIPVTGATVTGFSAISLLAAAAFVTMAVRSKKDRDE